MKRLLVLMLCFFMCCFSAFISSADEMIQYGDVNGDGCITAVDALRILQYAVGKFDLDEEAKVRADISFYLNPTEKPGIDANDALIVLQHGVHDHSKPFPGLEWIERV